MSGVRKHIKRACALAVSWTVILTGFLVLDLVTAPTAAALPGPVKQRPAGAVTADGIPTVQIDGVVWSQDIVGSTVYAGGKFQNARPAGAAPGTNLTHRGNFLSFDINTGQLNTSFAPDLNGEVKTVKASPDGKRVYVAGAFTTANGQTRNRIAAYDTATGQLISSFHPTINTTLAAITVTNDTVYAGGWFSQANGVGRTRLAAFRASDGALLAWAPTADSDLNTMTMTPDGSKVVIGGNFRNVNGSEAWGVAALDAVNGNLVPYQVNTVVRNAGSNAGIYNLTHDNDTVYGGQYNFGTGNFEGIFAVEPSNGTIKWLQDCHGDTYASFSLAGVIYISTHAHVCSNIGGYPEVNPRVEYPLIGVSKEATGTVLPNSQGGAGYGNFAGQPAPSMVNYFPAMHSSNFTGMYQNSWSLTGNTNYLVAGGEFDSVNGVKQQGLVRFAIPSKSPKKMGPEIKGGNTNPTVVALASDAVRINWRTNWDRDDQDLTYKLIRSDKPNDPLATIPSTAQFWASRSLNYKDSTVVGGNTYRYRVVVSDGDGNSTQSDYVNVTVPTGMSLSPYANQVLDDGAQHYWRLNENSGSALFDLAGAADLTKGAGVGHVAPGAINDDTDGAASFSGTSSGVAGMSDTETGPDVFSAEAWFKTTTNRGGKILGFGDQISSDSSSYDRHVYMQDSGKLTFGAYPGAVRTISSTSAYNDGEWHQVVASLSSGGMSLSVDGKQVAQDSTVTSAQAYNGHWRVGGDNLSSWTGAPSSNYFNGSIDDVAIYPTKLSAAQVRDHFTLSGRSLSIPPAPTDAYGKAIYQDDPDLYWRLDDASGPTAKDTSPNAADGTYAGGVTYQTASPVSGTSGKAVRFNGSDGTVGSVNSYTNPTTYSEEVWFNTTTASGGKLIGFGDQKSGNSSNYDRHVYMDASGKLIFGVYTGTIVTIQSPESYNDGAWHQVTATQSSAGMRLYVDGALVASGNETQAQSYSGYWRVGGDTSWSGDPYFNGAIDEAAVYSTALSAAQVKAHYEASPAAEVVNESPVAAFTSQAAGLDVSFDGSTSSDPDGSIASYAWNFGDGTTGTGATPAHSYAAAGSYNVTLTVTDDHQATNAVTHTVMVTRANQAPVGSFTSTSDGLKVSFDASGSDDPDGTISSYDWNFGDGTTGTSATPEHTYTTPGTFVVTLTVTDNDGATGVASQSVTVVAKNQGPVAAFTSSPDGLSVHFDGSTSSDPDGTVASYAWNFGDGNTGTGVTPDHTFATAGSYDVTLTVTDDDGATNALTQSLSVVAGNTAPVAAFTSTTDGLKATFDASTSSDPGGAVGGYVWDFGDGATATGVKPPPHTFAQTGDYQVKLTVTDDQDATDSVTQAVSVSKANQAPVAAFTWTADGLKVSVDGSTSSDADGTVSSYAWDFGGDETASGSTAAHTFVEAGDHPVTLTVTDDDGDRNVVTQTVTVSTGTSALASDSFARTGAGWGSADKGGAWTPLNAGALSTGSGTGNIRLGSPGTAAGASLDSLSTSEFNMLIDVKVDKVTTGSGVTTNFQARRVGNSNYTLKLRAMADGVTHLALSRMINGAETTIYEVDVAGATYAPGDVLRVRYQVTGTGTTTMSGKVWKVGGTEPTAPQITRTDNTAALQTPGNFAIVGYLGGSATNAPIVTSIDNLAITTGQTP